MNNVTKWLLILQGRSTGIKRTQRHHQIRRIFLSRRNASILDRKSAKEIKLGKNSSSLTINSLREITGLRKVELLELLHHKEKIIKRGSMVRKVSKRGKRTTRSALSSKIMSR